uniref:Uncharacterized protein n=1 Tax=Solanum demissum TaxID=50514 RepID=Q6L409_SOLDE|nr:hypothetical protein SDM1_44t00005 [Solanum demissum]
MSLKSDWPRGILFQSQLLYSKQEARENPCWYTYVFVYLVSEIVRGRREATERGQRVERGERDWEREERGEQEMAESGERLIAVSGSFLFHFKREKVRVLESEEEKKKRRRGEEEEKEEINKFPSWNFVGGDPYQGFGCVFEWNPLYVEGFMTPSVWENNL